MVVVVVVTAPAVVVSATVAPPVVAAAPKLVVCPSDCEVEVWLHVSVTWPHWYSHVNSQLDTVHVASQEFTEYHRVSNSPITRIIMSKLVKNRKCCLY